MTTPSTPTLAATPASLAEMLGLTADRIPVEQARVALSAGVSPSRAARSTGAPPRVVKNLAPALSLPTLQPIDFGGLTPADLEAVREQIHQATPHAIRAICDVLEAPEDVPPNIRLRAAEFIITSAGIGPMKNDRKVASAYVLAERQALNEVRRRAAILAGKPDPSSDSATNAAPTSAPESEPDSTPNSKPELEPENCSPSSASNAVSPAIPEFTIADALNCVRKVKVT